MAKRAAPNEQPYRPLLDASLVSATLTQVATPVAPPKVAAEPVGVTRVVEMRTELPRRVEPTVPQIESTAKEPPPSPAQLLVEKFDQEKRVLFTRGETQSIDRLVTSLATRLNTQVKVSHVMRALVGLLLHAEAEVDRRAGEAGALTRPPNGDALALQRFEREFGCIIASGIRDAGPIK